MLNYKISYTTSSSGQQRWEWGTQLRVVDNFQNSRMTWNALWKIISVILAKQSCSLESFPLNTSFNSVCNNRWKYKRKEVVGPVSAFEVNSLKQRVTVNDCHPCSVHPMLWSLRDFTTVQLRVVLARPQWPQVSRQLPQSGRVVCFESFRSHKWKRNPNLLEAQDNRSELFVIYIYIYISVPLPKLLVMTVQPIYIKNTDMYHVPLHLC